MTNKPIEKLATVVVLNDEVQHVKNLHEFAHFTTTETTRLIPYKTSYLWTMTEASGLSIIGDTPIENAELMNIISHIHTLNDAGRIHQVDVSLLTKNLPKHLLWCPFQMNQDTLSGGLIYLRDEPFTEADINMISWLIADYQFVFASLVNRASFSWLRKLKNKWVIGIILVILLFPVRPSVSTSATVISSDPTHINAPLDGVIATIAVQPGQVVKAGQVLLTLDQSEQKAKVDVLQKKQLLTLAKLRTAINEGMNDEQVNAEIPALKAQLAIDTALLQNATVALNKMTVTSPVAGVVIFNGTANWLGQPVHVGEQVLVVTDPKKVALAFKWSAAMNVGADGVFYVMSTHQSYAVKVKRPGYAEFVKTDNLPAAGALGLVKLYGTRVAFLYLVIARSVSDEAIQ